jgi:hypothetical protein
MQLARAALRRHSTWELGLVTCCRRSSQHKRSGTAWFARLFFEQTFCGGYFFSFSKVL